MESTEENNNILTALMQGSISQHLLGAMLVGTCVSLVITDIFSSLLATVSAQCLTGISMDQISQQAKMVISCKQG